jgi:UDP-2,4-diacetamido-2,4,6-trideoxy-beta-L-altropyranose hydrolase
VTTVRGESGAGLGVSNAAALHVLVRTDGNDEQGMGHAIRSSALAGALRAKGCRVSVIVKDSVATYVEQLRDDGFGIETIARNASLEEDAHVVCEQVKRRAVGGRVLVVTDGYAYTTPYQRIVHSSGAVLLCIDDLAQCEYVADIVLNQNLWATAGHYRCGPDTTLLLGPKYALIREAFRRRETVAQVDAFAARLVVTFGGADTLDQTFRIARLVDEAGWPCQTTLIAGPAYPYLKRLREWVVDRRERFAIAHDPVDVHRILAQADLAVSAAGSTCWELCCLGVPSALLVVDQSQVENAKALGEREVFESFGWYNGISDAELKRRLAQLLANQPRRAEMRAKAMTLVDGHGADRAATAVLNHVMQSGRERVTR